MSKIFSNKYIDVDFFVCSTQRFTKSYVFEEKEGDFLEDSKTKGRRTQKEILLGRFQRLEKEILTLIVATSTPTGLAIWFSRKTQKLRQMCRENLTLKTPILAPAILCIYIFVWHTQNATATLRLYVLRIFYLPCLNGKNVKEQNHPCKDNIRMRSINQLMKQKTMLTGQWMK